MTSLPFLTSATTGLNLCCNINNIQLESTVPIIWLLYYLQYDIVNIISFRCALTGHILGCVNDYKVNRKIFRDLARQGDIAGIKFVSIVNCYICNVFDTQ